MSVFLSLFPHCYAQIERLNHFNMHRFFTTILKDSQLSCIHLHMHIMIIVSSSFFLFQRKAKVISPLLNLINSFQRLLSPDHSDNIVIRRSCCRLQAFFCIAPFSCIVEPLPLLQRIPQPQLLMLILLLWKSYCTTRVVQINAPLNLPYVFQHAAPVPTVSVWNNRNAFWFCNRIRSVGLNSL